MSKTLVFILLILHFKALPQAPAQIIPDFEFFRFEGSQFSNKDLSHGKMIFFLFFDADCDHCHRAIENINKNYKSFSHISVYLVSMDDQQKMNDVLKRYGPELKKQKNVLLLEDRNKQFISKFNPRRYPSMYLYSAENKLVDYEDNEETVYRIMKFITE